MVKRTRKFPTRRCRISSLKNSFSGASGHRAGSCSKESISASSVASHLRGARISGGDPAPCGFEIVLGVGLDDDGVLHSPDSSISRSISASTSRMGRPSPRRVEARPRRTPWMASIFSRSADKA